MLDRAELDDANLVEKARHGHEAAFAQLYRRHVRYVAGVLHRIMFNASDVDDLLQQAFSDAYANLDRLTEPEGFRRWVTCIATRRAYDLLTARRRAKIFRSGLQWILAPKSDPRDIDHVDALYEALDAIAPKLRIPWVLSELEGHTVETVAALCGVSVSTAKRRLASAEAALRRRLDAR